MNFLIKTYLLYLSSFLSCLHKRWSRDLAGLILIMNLLLCIFSGFEQTLTQFLMLNMVWFCRGAVSYPHSLTQLETIPGYYWETGSECSKGSRWGISGFWKCQNNFMFGASIVTWHLLASGCAFLFWGCLSVSLLSPSPSGSRPFVVAVLLAWKFPLVYAAVAVSNS